MKQKYNVLIVDDHQIVLDGLRSILKSSPFNIVGEAANGQQAFDFIKNSNTPIDLVLTDISMPTMSGTDLCVLIKETYPEIKVLILSMYDSAPMIREALAAEADGFVIKNTGKEDLLTGLQTIANNGHYYSKEIVPILMSQTEKTKKQIILKEQLSEREIEVLTLILKEKTSEQIATVLNISKKTVDNHRTSILNKTGYTSTVGLVKYALSIGLEY
jgi:DNA-binding NarL/FixJ family response regulator